jgi:hypothetical protein
MSCVDWIILKIKSLEKFNFEEFPSEGARKTLNANI